MKGWCGESVPRVDGDDKARGATRYTGDLDVPGLWYGAAVRSPVARGKLLGLHWDEGFNWSHVVRVTPAFIPGKNTIAIIEQDMPCLADDEIRYLGEPVALIAAPEKAMLEEALAAVQVDVEPVQPLLVGLDEVGRRYSADPESLEYLHRVEIEKGDIAAGLDEADEVVEGIYRTDPQEHAYIEPQAVLATPLENGGVKILGSMQCPYYVLPSVALALGLPEDRVIVEQAPTGGAFGGKEDFPSVIATYAALLALEARAPVQMLLDREQDMNFSTKRHASWTRVRAGVKRDGTFTALEMDFLLDGGAYVTLSPVVLSRGAIHATGTYEWPNITIRARVVRSDTPPAGAFRGFGAPQAHYAIESHVDRIAAHLGLSPLELRRLNLLRNGSVTGTGQTLDDAEGIGACLEAVVKSCDYEARARLDSMTRKMPGEFDRGIGLALFWHGGGFTGSGEEKIASRSALELTADGKVDVLISQTEMGQGARTAIAQIVAEACGIPIDRVRYALPTTDRVPNSGPTVASRTIMVVGKILERCGRDLIEVMARRLGRERGDWQSWEAAVSAALEHGPLRVERTYAPPPGMVWDEETHRGSAYPCYAWGAAAIEVTVDHVTCEVTPENIWCAVEVGKAINPIVVRGQIEGGLVQALGWGMLEQLTFDERGAYRENRFQTYIIPTSLDVPPIHIEVLEMPYPYGPSGAKGIGEMPMNGLAAAVRNAIRDALGVSVDSAPATPEKILAALRAKAGEGGDG